MLRITTQAVRIMPKIAGGLRVISVIMIYERKHRHKAVLR